MVVYLGYGLNVGDCSTGHAVQTDTMPDLNELAIAMQALIKLVHSLQDLFICKSIVQAQYEEKVEEQASKLCKYYTISGEDKECSPGNLKFLHNRLHKLLNHN
ncbi:LOW QUALITY PROTEIN: uncharacterized protein C10orf67 homolog, mitochondrial [Porphyrio hochstetteri]